MCDNLCTPKQTLKSTIKEIHIGAHNIPFFVLVRPLGVSSPPVHEHT